MQAIPPSNPEDFNALMREIDSALSAEGIRMPHRPMRAIIEIGKRYSIPIPIAGRRDAAMPGKENWQLTDRVFGWYDLRYGESLKIDPSRGRFFTEIYGDLWIVRIPLVLGSGVFYASAILDTDKQHGRYNIADFIDNFTDELRRSLTQPQEAFLINQFRIAFDVLPWMEEQSSDSLYKSALADIEASVDSATRQRHDFGLSKWSSLQATEKTLKAAIYDVGGEFSNTHSLRKLIEEATRFGLTLNMESDVEHIQCGPGIRYGDERCDMRGALNAHLAMLRVLWVVKAGMAKIKGTQKQ